ncbi:unnamed protein product [Soboliphyme baturini]|uniref:Arrestin_C domain-containing protein n=1 Tax=Soboliphyme baturini TaxID=241478 RepID=A0A183IXF5_9BILA|nr:unnamed protein product [Soboliphyme baturini]
MMNSEMDSENVYDVQKFDITYERADGVYYAEDDVNGNICIVLSSPLRVQELRLTFKGRAKWDCPSEAVLQLNSVHNRSHDATSEVVFYDKEVVLVDRLPGKDLTGAFVLSPGSHILPFTFPLPKHVETSFEDKNGTCFLLASQLLPCSIRSCDTGFCVLGSIRYFCQAVLSRPWNHDFVTERPFTVLKKESTLDSNCLDLLKPVSRNDSEKVTTCCNSGVISCETSLPKQLFFPGETVFGSMKVSSDSRCKLTKLVTRLEQKISYPPRASGKNAATSNRVVLENDLAKQLGSHSKMDWLNEKLLVIPSLPPSVKSLTIASIEYEVQMEFSFAGSTDQVLYLQIPIVVGSVFCVPPLIELLSSSDGKKSLLSLVPHAGSYRLEDCVFGKTVFEMKNNPSSFNLVEFVPRYPVIEI